ncbi:DUF5658 family protein [Metabacillus halosaccharovorans]|uniref:DUF5658 family protein n=1 Tax=Metabacillus halosaccharovorans TaxID=930124 RepID=UPI003558E9B5
MQDSAFFCCKGLHFYFAINKEANPLMNVLLDLGPMPFLFTKILLSSFLFSLLYFDKIPNWNILKRILGVGSILYTIIIGFHGFWIIEVFYS